LENATRNAQACEYHHGQVMADAERLRSQALTEEDEIRAQNARAWADRIAVDCRAWRDEVALEQGRLNAAAANRQTASRSMQGLAGTQSGSVHCTSRTIGYTTHTDCN
jgi:hypothetical protein